MKSILNNYLNIIKILKLAKLTDEEYRTIYDPSGKFTSAFLNQSETINPHRAVERLESMPITGEIAKEIEKLIGPNSMKSLYDLFLFAKPDIPTEILIKERNEVSKRENNKNVNDFLNKINYDKSLLKIDDLSNLIQTIEESIKSPVNSKLKKVFLERIKRSFQKGEDTSVVYDNIIQYLIPYYEAGINEKDLLYIVDLFVEFKQNPNDEFLASRLEKELLSIMAQRDAAGNVGSSRVKMLDKILNIRHSDIFDFLKNELGKTYVDEPQELSSGDIIGKIEPELKPESELQYIDEATKPDIKRPSADEVTKADIVASFTEAFAIVKKYQVI